MRIGWRALARLARPGLNQKLIGYQEVSLGTLTALENGDFLFIDTTHAVKLGSDVNHLIFNVLPLLKSGVYYIHIYDIFLPYEYPKRWYDEISIFWLDILE